MHLIYNLRQQLRDFNIKTMLILCSLFMMTNAFAFPGGTYTINPSAAASASNYVSFTAFANDLKNVTRGDGGPAQYAVGAAGVQGPVVVNVTPGTYTQQFKLNQILGVTATNTVTINGNGAILQFTAISTTDAATLDMDGTDYFTIRNLELRALGTYGYCIWMHNAADRNIIRKNRFNCPNFTTTTQTAYLWMTQGTTSPTLTYGNAGNFNLIDSNDMRTSTANGPYYGVVMVGPSTAPYASTNANNFNTFSNNNLQDFYLYGLYTYYTSGLTINGNTIHNTGVTRYTTKYGLYLYYTSAIIDANKIYNLNGSTPQTGTMYPIYWYNYDNGTNFTNQKFKNNIIHVFGTGAIYCYMYFYTNIANGATLDVENNTYAFAYNSTVANTSTNYMMYGSYWRNVENNIVYNNLGGTGTKYLHYDNGGCTSYANWKNNNFYYGAGAAGTLYNGYGGSPCVTTSDMAGMYAAGMNSTNISVEPDFIDLGPNSDLTPTGIGMANKGKVVTGLTKDFKGATRSSTPDIGALEYTVDLQVTAFNLTFPSPACSGFTSAIGGTIKNNSAYTLKNPTMAYRINNNAKVNYTLPSATIAPGASYNFNFPGTYKFSVSGNTKVSMFVSTPDDAPLNDSMSTSTVITRAPGGAVLTQNTSLSSPFAKLDITGKPDITFESEAMVYDYTAPSRVGYTNADYGTKWIAYATAKTVNGTNANAAITASTTAPFYVTVNAAKKWEDSTLVISTFFVDLATACDTMYTRRILIAPKAVPNFILPNPFCERAETFIENTTTVSSGIVDYEWDFGDGSPVSIQTSPIHTYDTYGTYTITMKATTSPYGFKNQKSIVVNVKEVPVAKIINTNKCEGTKVILANGTIGGSGVLTYTWHFTDGTPDIVTSTASTVTKAFATPGPKVVTLSASADGCADVVSKVVYQFARPIADFSKVTGSCLNEQFAFKDNSSISLGDYGHSWNFDDNGNIASDPNPVYNFSAAGVKNVKLKVTSEFGCTDSITKPIVVKQTPTTDFSYPFACNRTATQFTNLTNLNGEVLNTYTWNFGQGAPVYTTNPIVSWSQLGPRTISLKTTLFNGCSSEMTKSINVGVQPTADFEFDTKCANTPVPFTNLTTFPKGVINYSWDFGDGGTSKDAAPIHTYSTTSAQTFLVKLKSSIVGGCSDSVIKSVTITPLPTTCDFNLTRNWPVNSRNFVYSPIGGAKTGITYTWITGDGNKVTSNATDANYTYSGNLQYCVTMIAKTVDGCECTATKCIDLNTGVNVIDKGAFSIYPNPSSGVFNIKSTTESGVLNVNVYNVVGELVKTIAFDNSSAATLDLTYLNSGVYFVNISDGNQSTTQKINIIK